MNFELVNDAGFSEKVTQSTHLRMICTADGRDWGLWHWVNPTWNDGNNDLMWDLPNDYDDDLPNNNHDYDDFKWFMMIEPAERFESGNTCASP